MKEYKPGTFDKRVAYGQRERKLVLVSRGIMDGFRVQCRSEKEANNLVRAFRSRCMKIERRDYARYAVGVKLKGRMVYVTRKGPLQR